MKFLKQGFLVFILLSLLIFLVGCPMGVQNSSQNQEQIQQIQNIYFTYPLRKFPIGKVEGSQYYWDCSENDFCDTYNGKFHSAEDWNLKGGRNDIDEGKPVYSIGEGKVIYSKEEKDGSGNDIGFRVVIEHTGTCIIPAKENIKGSGISYEEEVVGKIYSVYLHLKDVKVKVGDEVKIDTIVGTITKTQAEIKASTGPHLHFEIRKEAKIEYNSYFGSIQQVVDLGFRDPSEFIKANMIGSKVIKGVSQTIPEESISIETENIKQDSNINNDFLSFNIVGGCKVFYEPRDICSDGNYVYIVTEDTLEIYDVSNENNPKIIGGTSEITGFMRCAFLNNNILYTTSYQDLKSYNISDKMNPKILSRNETLRFGCTYEIYIYENFAFVASDAFINVFDISNFEKPKLIHNPLSTYTGQSIWSTGKILVTDNIAFLGLIDGIMIYNINNEGIPEITDHVEYAGEVYGIDIENDNLIIACNYDEDESELKILDKTNIKNLDEKLNMKLEFAVYNLKIIDKLIYLATNKGLIVVDINDINKIIIKLTNIKKSLKDFYFIDNKIYLLTDEGFLMVK